MKADLGNSVTPPNINDSHIIVASEEKREKRQRVYLRKLELKSSLICRKKQISKSRKHRELPSKSTKAGQHQDIL